MPIDTFMAAYTSLTLPHTRNMLSDAAVYWLIFTVNAGIGEARVPTILTIEIP